MEFAADETCDIGFEAGSAVIVGYEAAKGRFNGAVNWVEIDIGDADHCITDEERDRVAIAIQQAGPQPECCGIRGPAPDLATEGLGRSGAERITWRLRRAPWPARC